MTSSATGVLPPSYHTTGEGPAYPCVSYIIEDIWDAIHDLEVEIVLNYSHNKVRELEYMYNLLEHWEEIYLILNGRRYALQFL